MHHYPMGLSRFRPIHFSPIAPNFPLDSSLSSFNGHYLPMYPSLLSGRFFRTGENLQSVLSECRNRKFIDIKHVLDNQFSSLPSHVADFQNDLCSTEYKLGVQKHGEMLNSTLSPRNVKDDEVSSSEEIARHKSLEEGKTNNFIFVIRKVCCHETFRNTTVTFTTKRKVQIKFCIYLAVT